jgi:iron(III) transport system substrate-binding protein
MKRIKIFLLMAVFVLLMAACGPQETQPSIEAPVEQPVEEIVEPVETASGTITLYTSEPEDKIAEMVVDFNAMYPDVTVNVFRSGSGEVIAKIQAEKEAGEIQADILWFADLDFFNNLADEGLFMVYRPVGSDMVDEIYHYNGDRYQEVRAIFNIIAYNTTLVTTPPTSWKDLLDPQYAGKVGMPSALYSGAAFNQVGTFINMPEFGWEFYEALNQNGVVVERGNGGVQTKVASGEFAIVQVVDFMARDVKNAGSPVEHIWPEEGALLVPTPIGILDTTKNPGGAKAFMDYMYTESAQELFVTQGYISVFENIDPPLGVPDMSTFKVLMPDFDHIAANRDSIRSEFERIFGVPAE